MRVTLMTPEGEVSPGILIGLFSLVDTVVPYPVVLTWTKYERLLAYDWAIRVHLHASDNPVRLRERPSFVTANMLTRAGT